MFILGLVVKNAIGPISFIGRVMKLLFSYRFNCRPAIKKNRMMIMGRGTKKWIAPNHEYKRWEEAWARRLSFERPDEPVITDPVEMQIVFHFKDHRDPDLSNALEGVADVMQKANIISNDKLIRKIVAEKFIGKTKEDWFEVKLFSLGE